MFRNHQIAKLNNRKMYFFLIAKLSTRVISQTFNKTVNVKFFLT